VSTAPDAAPTGEGHQPDRCAPAHLAPDQRALVDRLASGDTIAVAAQAEFLPLPTANRRIAQARQVLDARSTREAVLVYRRLRREGS
jgi:hypothetical protein